MKVGYQMKRKRIALSPENVRFRLAETNDIEQIMQLVKLAIDTMKKKGIDQWDELYPCEEDFCDDIVNHSLYMGCVDNKLVSIFTINNQFDEAYFAEGIKWKFSAKGASCIHRLCVHPEFQGHQIGKKTLLYAEQIMKNSGFESVRLDVFSENPVAIRLYENNGYVRKGSAFWRKGEFFLMEKAL